LRAKRLERIDMSQNARTTGRLRVAPVGFCVAAAFAAASCFAAPEGSPAATAKQAAPEKMASASESAVPSPDSKLTSPTAALLGAGNVTFLVRFAEDHPLGRAQALRQRGSVAEAERLARINVREDFNLQGLCFERFARGGAEIVLGACTPPAIGQESAFRNLWVGRFAEMSGVEYADLDFVAHSDGRPPA
jgi:hypothetical protein